MNIYNLGIIVEVAIPFKTVAKYKTEVGLERFIVNRLRDFVHSIEEFNGVKVGYASTKSFDVTPINDFNYNYNNQLPKKEGYNVYRYFGADLFLLSELEDVQLDEFNNLHFFGKDQLTYLVYATILGKKQPTTSPITLIGVKKYNESSFLSDINTIPK